MINESGLQCTFVQILVSKLQAFFQTQRYQYRDLKNVGTELFSWCSTSKKTTACFAAGSRTSQNHLYTEYLERLRRRQKNEGIYMLYRSWTCVFRLVHTFPYEYIQCTFITLGFLFELIGFQWCFSVFLAAINLISLSIFCHFCKNCVNSLEELFSDWFVSVFVAQNQVLLGTGRGDVGTC